MPWNPDTYNKFKAERHAPFYDLVKLIQVKNNLSVIDLGCGTGELTHTLAGMLPGSTVWGIDSSAEMLEKTKQFEHEGLSFAQKNIEEIISSGMQWNLIFSNAAIQWVDNHRALISGLVKLLKQGGQLAIQLPSNHNYYTHTAIKEMAARSPYKEALKGWVRTVPVLSIEEYAELLFRNGVTGINVFEKVYPHVLENSGAMVEWVSGTALVPYLEKLPEEMHEQFFSEYRKMMKDKFPGSPVFYPFKRTFIYGIIN